MNGLRRNAKILMMVVAGLVSVAHATDDFPSMEVSEGSARVMDMQGHAMCTIPHGTKLQPRARDESSEQILVDLKYKGCPKSGIVDADSIDFQDSDEAADSQATVSKQGAHMRSSPDMKPESIKCSLNTGKDVEIISDEEVGRRIHFSKVRLKKPVAGCPREGYIASNLLELADPYAPLGLFNVKDKKNKSEGNPGCTTCANGKSNLELDPHKIRAAVRRGSYQAQVARALTAAAKRGVGHVGKNLCYRAVKNIIASARANGKRIGDPSKVTGGSAMDAMLALPRAGFKNGYPEACHDAGAVLVYEGPAHALLGEYNRAHTKAAKAAVMRKVRRIVLQKYGARATAGDLHGHIEILGTDGRYHHFVDSPRPMSQSKLGAGGRRKLIGCFIAQ